MELTEDEIIQKYVQHSGHCNRNTLQPYQNEFTCFSCGYNLIKRKHKLSEIQQKRINLINRICVDVY